MRQGLRENALCALVAAGGCAAMAWLGLYGFAWGDYEVESRPAFEALVHGHVLGFLRLAPAYGGSLVERAPFALLPGLWGGGALAVYRMVALPCLLATAGLGVWLVARMRARGHSTLARAVALAICVANPITLRTLETGHPEELLGACMCVAAVLVAARSSNARKDSLLAGVLLGLAIANKEWAVGLWPRARRTTLSEREALLALALVLLLRCVLDTWDAVYYPLPFLLTLLAWEVGRDTRRPPVLALSATVLVWISFQWLPEHVSPDAQAAAFLAWSAPLAAWLGVRLFAAGRASLASRLGAGEAASSQETTVSALGRLVRTS